MPWFTYFSLSLFLKNLVVYSIKNFEVKINLGAIGFWEGCAPPQKIFNFLLLNGAFCMHSEAFIRQHTRPVTIMLKPAKTSDVVVKPCNVVNVGLLQELNLDI